MGITQSYKEHEELKRVKSELKVLKIIHAGVIEDCAQTKVEAFEKRTKLAVALSNQKIKYDELMDKYLKILREFNK